MLLSSSGRPARSLPESVQLEWPTQGFAFFPDGTANGGDGAIAAAGRGSRFRVDPATSRLVFLPFRQSGYDFVQCHCGFSLSKNAFNFGRKI